MGAHPRGQSLRLIASPSQLNLLKELFCRPLRTFGMHLEIQVNLYWMNTRYVFQHFRAVEDSLVFWHDEPRVGASSGGAKPKEFQQLLIRIVLEIKGRSPKIGIVVMKPSCLKPRCSVANVP